jgi:outer membrane protein assembly factor BamE
MLIFKNFRYFSQTFKILILCFIGTLLISNCSNLRFPGVYKIDVAQGNIVTQDLLDQLKPGMSGNQVIYILGSPLIQDTFNENRWDYYYSMKSGRTEITKTSRVTVYFESSTYQRYELFGNIRESSIRREPLKPTSKRKKFLWIF